MVISSNLNTWNLNTWVAHQATMRAILSDDYFISLTHDMSREIFVRTQQQFFFAVRYFSRPMAMLTSRMASSEGRLGLIHNLAEEHGADEDRPAVLDPTLAHDKTFLQFLGTLDVSQADVATLRERSAVRAFNTSLMGTCLMEPIGLAFGCLGVIEYTFAGICKCIGEIVVERGWISVDELVHYKLHAEIDERHAEDFFNVVKKDWETGDLRRQEVEDGVLLGLHVFGRLYDDLLIEALENL